MEVRQTDGKYLQLSSNPIRFEPVSRITNVFFDVTNKEVVSVRGGGTLGVVVQGLHTKETFIMEQRGNISSIKLSPNHTRLAVQRTPNSLELFSFDKHSGVGPSVVVECRTKNAALLGLVWADFDDLVLITSHGVEFYSVSKERVFVRLVRTCNISSCHWFTWSAECQLLMVAAGSAPPGQLILHPFQLGSHFSNKMTKCVVDLNQLSGVVGGYSKPSAGVTDAPPTPTERDVCVAFVYRPAVLVLRHPSESQMSAKLLVYTCYKDSSGFKLTHVCQLELSGSFALNVIDSLIIVHHQTSKVSMVFDIALGTEIKDGVCLVYPITTPAPIRPCYLEEPSVATATTSSATVPIQEEGDVIGLNSSKAMLQTDEHLECPSAINRIPCQLYSLTWVVFPTFCQFLDACAIPALHRVVEEVLNLILHLFVEAESPFVQIFFQLREKPSVIIDARLGCLWTLQLDLSAFAATFSDSVQLICCLLNRRHAKPLLLRILGGVVKRRSLQFLSLIFDHINAGYRRHLDAIAAQNQQIPAASTSVGVCTSNSAVGVAPAAYQPISVAFGALSPPTSSLLKPRQSGVSVNLLSMNPPVVVVEPVDIYSIVLSPMMDEAQKTSKTECSLDAERQYSDKPEDTNRIVPSDHEANQSSNEGVLYMVSVTLEYIRSLLAAGLPVPNFLPQMVVNALLHCSCYFQLHQLLQYHIIPDSKPLACVLLSRAGVYPACLQLSLDMLSRISATHDEIIEVLLANGHITRALRYACVNGLEDTLSSRKFLEAAMQTHDDSLFYSTFVMFALHHARRPTARPLGEGDHCEVYVKHFQKLFGALPDFNAAPADV